MTYKQAWNQLKLNLMGRGEYFFFGDHKEAERTVHFTLEKMRELEGKITKITVAPRTPVAHKGDE